MRVRFEGVWLQPRRKRQPECRLQPLRYWMCTAPQRLKSEFVLVSKGWAKAQPLQKQSGLESSLLEPISLTAKRSGVVTPLESISLTAKRPGVITPRVHFPDSKAAWSRVSIFQPSPFKAKLPRCIRHEPEPSGFKANARFRICCGLQTRSTAIHIQSSRAHSQQSSCRTPRSTASQGVCGTM